MFILAMRFDIALRLCTQNILKKRMFTVNLADNMQ